MKTAIATFPEKIEPGVCFVDLGAEAYVCSRNEGIVEAVRISGEGAMQKLRTFSYDYGGILAIVGDGGAKETLEFVG